MQRDDSFHANIGSARSPIDIGQGRLAYKRNGHWHCCDAKADRRLGRKFLEVTDPGLILELEARGYQILNPAHECVDRPNLPCPACEKAAQQARRSAS